SKAMHNEPWAPDVESKNTMGNGLKYYYQDTGAPQRFEAPSWIYHFPSCEDFAPGRHPRFISGVEIGDQWMIELGGMQDTYADAEEIRDDLLRLIFGLWDHLKNHCPPDRQRAARCKLLWVGHVAGKRENRRLIGDYVLTQNDIGEQTLFPDRVAYGGWIVDDHHSGGFFHVGSFGKHYDDPSRAYAGLPFSIPFRCLYSKNVENLLMAGRNISATHLALANTRVMLTCAVIGHAAGVGAALCVEHGATPREIGERYIEQLQQQLLKDGAYIIDLPNRDPRDLARRARVAASSEGLYKGKPMAAANIINGRARAEDDNPNAWAPDPKTPPPHWVELAWPQPQTFNMVHVTFQTAALAPKRFAVEAWLDGAWRQIAAVTENQHRRHVLGLDRLARQAARARERAARRLRSARV
ncbi:MAG: FAD-dependent oxidoreductase, partial [Verrucomicrobiae bacterium]|nr:FAD-dependent oxidoreductase [Verrucomicrobiae bacterium]